MIDALWNNSGWFFALLPLAAYAVKFSRFVSFLGILGPLAAPVQALLEGVAAAVSVVLTWAIKSVWHCLFNPVTWGALLTIYFVGGFYPAQHVAGKLLKKRPAIVQPVASKKPVKRRTDSRSITLRNFMR